MTPKLPVSRDKRIEPLERRSSLAQVTDRNGPVMGLVSCIVRHVSPYITVSHLSLCWVVETEEGQKHEA